MKNFFVKKILGLSLLGCVINCVSASKIKEDITVDGDIKSDNWEASYIDPVTGVMTRVQLCGDDVLVASSQCNPDSGMEQKVDDDNDAKARLLAAIQRHRAACRTVVQ